MAPGLQREPSNPWSVPLAVPGRSLTVSHSRLVCVLIGCVLAAGALALHFNFHISSVYSGNTVSGERDNSGAFTAYSKFADQIKGDKDSELDVMAIMKSEEKSPEGRKALLETMYNRANAHGVTDIQKALGNRDKETAYYEPFWNGSFEKNRREIAANPALQEQLRKEIDEVHAGSNFSNFGTQNASADKAEKAIATQTVTAHYPGGDYFSRKDVTEHDTAHGGPHGVAYTRQEQEWAKSTEAALDRETSEHAAESGLPKSAKKPVSRMMGWEFQFCGAWWMANPLIFPSADAMLQSTRPARRRQGCRTPWTSDLYGLTRTIL